MSFQAMSWEPRNENPTGLTGNALGGNVGVSHGWCREDGVAELTESVSRLEAPTPRNLPSRRSFKYQSLGGPKGHRGFFLLQGTRDRASPATKCQPEGSPS